MTVSLRPVPRNDLPLFKQRLQTAFTQAVAERFPEWTETIPPDSDIDETLAAPGTETFHLVAIAVSDEGLEETEATIGGAIVTANGEGRYTLDFIFIDPAFANQGLGQAAWCAIEKYYPDARVWELVTPAHEHRNIHFYVNCCGFSIVEYFNERHPDPHFPHEEAGNYPGTDEGLFRFEKRLDL